MPFLWFFYSTAGGDQMTVARTRGSQHICSNAERGKDRLEGFMGVVEGVSVICAQKTTKHHCLHTRKPFTAKKRTF